MKPSQRKSSEQGFLSGLSIHDAVPNSGTRCRYRFKKILNRTKLCHLFCKSQESQNIIKCSSLFFPDLFTVQFFIY